MHALGNEDFVEVEGDTNNVNDYEPSQNDA
jgi:hypothetical protein